MVLSKKCELVFEPTLVKTELSLEAGLFLGSACYTHLSIHSGQLLFLLGQFFFCKIGIFLLLLFDLPNTEDRVIVFSLPSLVTGHDM